MLLLGFGGMNATEIERLSGCYLGFASNQINVLLL